MSFGRCGGDEKKRMTTQNRQKSNAKKKGAHVIYTHLYVMLTKDKDVCITTLVAYETLYCAGNI